MRRILLAVIAVMVAASFHAERATAQTMELSASALTPQASDGKPDVGSLGYGLAATYAYTGAHKNVHVIGTLQWHDHDRLQIAGEVEGVKVITDEVNRDIIVGVGVRLTTWGAFVQGTVGPIEKRKSSTEKETKFAVTVAVGYTPGSLGVQATHYRGDFGNHYGAGVFWRF